MTLEELKEATRELIKRNQSKAAIEGISKWARDNHQEELKVNVSLLEGRLRRLSSEKNLGILSNSDISTSQNKINYDVLNILNDITANSATTPGVKAPSSTEKLKILMLTANPANTTKLNLDKEHSVITQKLQERQDYFNIRRKKAVSGTEFKEFTQQERPDILHFSGHGEGGKYAGIIVQNDDKNGEALISVNGLKSLFKFFKKRFNIKVALLNACHTQEQAATIAEYVEYVIGTNVFISDRAASAFSSGFYFQLAEGDEMNIEDAFDSGRTEAVMKGAEEEHFVIYKNGELIEV